MTIHTLAERRQAQRIDSNRIDREVRDFQRNAQLALNDLVWALRNWHEVTGDTDYMADTVSGLHDDAAVVVKEMRQGLDAAGLHVDATLEFAELDELLAKVWAP